jgi:TPP-dependent indolepyruvate ferredoxin oxidoreductase alpha subunit
MDFCDDDASILFISTVYPLPRVLVNDFMAEMDEVSVSEGSYPTIELQIGDRRKIISEKMGGLGRRAKPMETMYGFTVVRDTIGPASSINLAHGMKISEPDKKVLAITFEDHFFHSGMPAFVNTLYNRSSYMLLILISEKEEQIRKVLEGFGFHNSFHIEGFSEIERFYDHQDLTVLFCKGII